MPEQAHVDALHAAVSELQTVEEQRKNAKAALQAMLDQFAPSLKEGHVRTLGPRVPAITMRDGKVQYVEIPSILDPDPPAGQ